MPIVSKTLEIRKCVKQIIEECGCKAYYEKANKVVAFPYAVFEFETTIISDNVKREIEVTIDIWDKSESSVAVEELADKISQSINYKLLFPSGESLRLYGVRKRSLPDEDESLRRRQIECSIIYFEKE